MADTSQVKEITTKLEQGVKDIFNSDTYADYLKTMSRFHRYSTRNTILIHMQRPNASLVAGFRSWQTKFGRNVKKGEKAIRILAPAPFILREEKEKVDPDTKMPILGEDGMPIVELTERQFARFKVTSVFDLEQTDGKPLPTLVQDLTGNVEQYAAFMDALREVSPLPIVIEPMPSDTDGTCYFGDKISIREGMSEIQTVCAIVHEIAHTRLHDISQIITGDETAKPKDRRTEEIEAESVAFSVLSFFNIETGANSFGYISAWSETRDLKELSASLDIIRKTAAELIDAIDGKLQDIIKDRGIGFAVPEPHPVLAEYARGKNDFLVGANVLLMPVFNDGNFNREGKKIRVKALEPMGKYQLFTHEEQGEPALYLMTASGRIDRTSQYFRDTWNEETRKWENHHPTEGELDELIPQIAAQFESDMADPDKWAMYQHAAVVNRLEDCEAHNVPVRQAREAQRQTKAQERTEQELAVRQERINAFNASVNELADTLVKNEKADIEIDRNLDKNPLFTLFDRHKVDLPLATKGWVNRNLRAVQVKPDGTVSVWLKKGAKTSETFCHAIRKLTAAVAADRAARTATHTGIKDGDTTMDTTERQTNNKPIPSKQQPDPSIGLSEMNLYGYNDDGIMLPLLQSRATELFDTDHAIYLLYPDNTEALAFDRDEILKHDGLFGIERGDWERSPILAAQLSVAKSAEGSREADLLYGDVSKFGIYQLKCGDETRDYRFEPLDRLHSRGLEVERKNYGLVYTAPLDIRITQTNLHKIYSTFNEERPADFTGHSLSVSDIIVLQWRGNVSSHYVDSVGFTELPSFLGEERQTPQAAASPEQRYSQVGNTPTVTELEADVNAGKAISLMGLAKAANAERGNRSSAPKPRLTLMERLEKNKQKAAAQGQPDPSKAANREV